MTACVQRRVFAGRSAKLLKETLSRLFRSPKETP
jgi:hypothetical protein